METFLNTINYQNAPKWVVSMFRKKSSEIDLIPIVDLKKLSNTYKPNFVKWETSLGEEHLPEIKTLIQTENLKMLKHLKKISVMSSVKMKWKTVIGKVRSSIEVEKEHTPNPELDEEVYTWNSVNDPDESKNNLGPRWNSEMDSWLESTPLFMNSSIPEKQSTPLKEARSTILARRISDSYVRASM